MKLVSWNVNGLRAIMDKGFMDFVTREDPDAVCLQETRFEGEQLLPLAHYRQHWNAAGKKGYSGVAVFTKASPLAVTKGIGLPEHDAEGRVLTLEFPEFFLVNVYVPNARRGLARLDYRMKWDRDFLGFLKALESKKPVVFCGDLNVAHREIDIARPKENRKNAGFTDEERAGFSDLLDAGFVDVFRHLYPDKVEYTWWSYMHNARAKNIGWRIDYFVISKSLAPQVKEANIYGQVMGSDHAPVGLVLA